VGWKSAGKHPRGSHQGAFQTVSRAEWSRWIPLNPDEEGFDSGSLQLFAIDGSMHACASFNFASVLCSLCVLSVFLCVLSVNSVNAVRVFPFFWHGRGGGGGNKKEELTNLTWLQTELFHLKTNWRIGEYYVYVTLMFTWNAMKIEGRLGKLRFIFIFIFIKTCAGTNIRAHLYSLFLYALFTISPIPRRIRE